MIVIPMAGLSKRFRTAGYAVPKYMLSAHGKTLFEHSVRSFEAYFNCESFLFVVLEHEGAFDFVEQKVQALGISDATIIMLPLPTGGQAETVYEGLKHIAISDEIPLTIFNIDTFRRGFRYPTAFDLSEVDGYLETFIGSGKNWSNVVPLSLGSDRVAMTAEKQELSEFCCTGLYYWRRAGNFRSIFESVKVTSADSLPEREYYIAPMYNALIANGADVRFHNVDRGDVIFCGVPQEYHAFLNSAADPYAAASERI